MATAQAQMNVRISEDRKAAGDAVLAKLGLNPSYAVRSLWDYLATHKALPDFMAETAGEGGQQRPSGESLAAEGAGMAIRLAKAAGMRCDALQSMSYEELRDAALEERILELEQRRV